MRNYPFISVLYGIADKAEQNRAPIAQIKKGASDPENNVFNVMKFIGHSIPVDDNYFSYAIALTTIFSLFPTKSSQANNSSSLGVLFRRIKNKLGKDSSKSFELRVNRIIDAHSDDLPKLLVTMVRYLKSQEVGNINYHQLMDDMIFWDSDDKNIQKRWAKEFWTFSNEDNITEDKNENSEIDND